MSETDFVAAQHISAQNQPADGSHRTYLLAGMLRCGTCGRSMQSQYSHGNAAYRCRHRHTSAHAPAMRQARNLYLREDVILGRVFAQLHTLTSRNASIRQDIADLQQGQNPTDLSRFLRTHRITIECHTTSIWLETEQESPAIIRQPAINPGTKMTIPKQRIQQQKQRRDIVRR